MSPVKKRPLQIEWPDCKICQGREIALLEIQVVMHLRQVPPTNVLKTSATKWTWTGIQLFSSGKAYSSQLQLVFPVCLLEIDW